MKKMLSVFFSLLLCIDVFASSITVYYADEIPTPSEPPETFPIPPDPGDIIIEPYVDEGDGDNF